MYIGVSVTISSSKQPSDDNERVKEALVRTLVSLWYDV